MHQDLAVIHANTGSRSDLEAIEERTTCQLGVIVSWSFKVPNREARSLLYRYTILGALPSSFLGASCANQGLALVDVSAWEKADGSPQIRSSGGADLESVR